MSKKIKERTQALASREKAIKDKLVGKSSLSSKANRIGKMALIGGVVALVLYAIYKSSFQGEKKSKKKTKGEKSASAAFTEKVATLALPYIGKFLERLMSDSKEEKKEEEPKSEN